MCSRTPCPGSCSSSKAPGDELPGPATPWPGCDITVEQALGIEDIRVRARLARFLFRGRRADQPVSTLSGGERFRATLTAPLLAEPAPQLLLRVEPDDRAAAWRRALSVPAATLAANEVTRAGWRRR